MTDEQLGDARDAGGNVCSREATCACTARRRTRRALSLGMRAGRGADLLRAASPSLLDELQVALRVLREQRSRVGAKCLVRMLTSDAAAIAGRDDRLGRIGLDGPPTSSSSSGTQATRG